MTRRSRTRQCEGVTVWGRPCRRRLIIGRYCNYHGGAESRCTAIRSDGEPCQRVPKPGTDFCAYHNDTPRPFRRPQPPSLDTAEVVLSCGHTNEFDLPPQPGRSAYCRRCAKYTKVSS